MSLETTRLVTLIQRHIANQTDINLDGLEQRKQTLAYLIGAVIGTQMRLPSTSVENKRLHYVSQVYPIVSKYVSDINEAYPIDIECALEACYTIWVERYELLHGVRVSARNILARVSMTMGFNNSHDSENVNNALTILSGAEADSLDAIFVALRSEIIDDLGEDDE